MSIPVYHLVDDGKGFSGRTACHSSRAFLPTTMASGMKVVCDIEETMLTNEGLRRRHSNGPPEWGT